MSATCCVRQKNVPDPISVSLNPIVKQPKIENERAGLLKPGSEVKITSSQFKSWLAARDIRIQDTINGFFEFFQVRPGGVIPFRILGGECRVDLLGNLFQVHA